MNNNDFSNWSPPRTLYRVLNGFYTELLNGYVKILSNNFGNPVIFVTKKSESRSKQLKDCDNEDLIIINNLREEEDKCAAFCKWLRTVKCENSEECTKSDFNAVLNLAKTLYASSSAPEDWEEVISFEEHNIKTVIYQYECFVGFCEWIIPIYINDVFEGAFITGQFLPDNFIGERIAEENDKLSVKINDTGLMYIESKLKILNLNDEKTDPELRAAKWQPIPDKTEGKVTDFVKKINGFQKQLNELQKSREEQEVNKIQNEILNIAWGIDSLYDSRLNPMASPWEIFTERLTATRTYLFDSIIKMRDIFQLQDIIVYKPRSNISGKENIPGVIQGADLLSERIKDETDDLTVNRDYAPSAHNIIIEKVKELQKSEATKISGELKFWHIDAPDDIRNMLRENPNATNGGSIPGENDLNNAHLIIYHMEIISDQFVAYYFKLNDESNFQYIEEIFQSLSAIFLAQWNGIYSEYNRIFYEASNQYLGHELGQIISGLQIANEKFRTILAPVLAMNRADLFDEYPNMPDNVLGLFSYANFYQQNIQDYTDFAAVITKYPFIEGRECKPEYFYPYKTFIFRLNNLYNRDLEAEYKELIIPYPHYNNPNYPGITADPLMLEQGVNNLLKNSIKYSHYFTKIYFDAKRAKGDGRKIYEFVITNYGEAIPEEQKDSIFSLWSRGENGENKDQSGLGFGLFISRYYARLHGGDVELVECEEICPYNVPLLNVYSKSTHRQVDENIQDECRKWIAKLSEKQNENGISLYDEIISEDPDNFVEHPFKPLYYLRKIDIPTARIKFKLWIPIEN